MVSEQKERKKEGSQEKRMEEHSMSAFFSVFWTPLFEPVLQEEFPLVGSMGSSISLTSAQMVSADPSKDAKWVAVNFASSCTPGQLVERGAHTHEHVESLLGCLWHS